MLLHRLPKEKFMESFVTLGMCLQNKLIKVAVLASKFGVFH